MELRTEHKAQIACIFNNSKRFKNHPYIKSLKLPNNFTYTDFMINHCLENKEYFMENKYDSDDILHNVHWNVLSLIELVSESFTHKKYIFEEYALNLNDWIKLIDIIEKDDFTDAEAIKFNEEKERILARINTSWEELEELNNYELNVA